MQGKVYKIEEKNSHKLYAAKLYCTQEEEIITNVKNDKNLNYLL